ncbi:MAG: ATP-binding protein [Acinetobacter calcoaceticus]
MLKGIWIENFKSYRTGQLLPLAPLTLMIGANASGKSNAIEAFRFLSWYVGGEKLSTIQNRINDSEKIFRGDIGDLFYCNSNIFTVGADFENYFSELRLDIKISKLNELNIKNESLKFINSEEKLYEITTNIPKKIKPLNENIDKILRVNITPEVKMQGRRNIFTFHYDNNSSILQRVKDMLLTRLDREDLIDNKIEERFNELKSVESAVENTYFYDFVPSQMRQDSLADFKLRPNGQNLAGVLYTLWRHNPHREDILKFIRNLPEQDFKTLKFYEDHRERIELALVENFANQEQEWNCDVLSDGTLRVLGIAAAILSVPEDSTLVIEEIDNGIHPSRAKSLLNTMLVFAEERHLKLLLTTHNPALMDALPDKALGDVVFAYRDPKQGDSRLIRLSDLEDYEGLVSQGSLGELVTKEVVDRFVKNPISSEVKKQKALNWLEQMRGISHE